MELIITFICLVVSCIFAGLWWWFWLAFAICAVVVIFELLAIKKTGKTLSKMIWDWGKENKAKAFTLIGVFSLFGLVLMYHLIKGIF